MTLQSESRLDDGRHLVACCKMVVEVVANDILENMGGAVPSNANVWNHVEIKHIFLMNGLNGSGDAQSKVFVLASGSC